MNPKRRPNYGVYVITRAMARRVRLEWENVESPALPAQFAVLPILPSPLLERPARGQERRPLAA